jgi:hypothetical protein
MSELVREASSVSIVPLINKVTGLTSHWASAHTYSADIERRLLSKYG